MNKFRAAVASMRLRTLTADFLLDLRSKGLFTAIWYFLRSTIRRFVIHNLSVYE